MPELVIPRPAAAGGSDAYRTTGTSPTLHLLGAGAVGHALLQHIAASRLRLIAASDSTATLFRADGLDALDVARWKAVRGTLRDHPAVRFPATSRAIALVNADVVIDATPSSPRAGWTASLGDALQRGRAVAFAAKHALGEQGAEWLDVHAERVGCNAVLGGTGRSLATSLPELRARIRGATIAGNASTTAIIAAIERGGTLHDGIAEAQQLGYLEPDPELDLRGADAAVKLAIVAAALTGRRIDVDGIAIEDIRSLDPALLRARARRGCTTRLIARLHDNGALTVAYEELRRDSMFAVPPGRVVYEYRLDRDERRLYVGTGLGAEATAAALWLDVEALARTVGGAR